MTDKRFLSKVEMLEADDIRTEDVFVPEWDGWVKVGTITGADRDKLEAETTAMRGNSRDVNFENLRAKVVAKCVVDENGKRIFADADVVALGKKSSAAIDRIFFVATRLNKVTQEDIEELTKNSGSGQSDDSGTV